MIASYLTDAQNNRTRPWSRIGQVVQKPLHDPDLLAHTKLDWTLELAPVSTSDTVALADGDSFSTHTPIKGFQATRRSDTKQVLGIVGSGWKPCQNRDMLDFLTGLSSDLNATVETAGCVNDGRLVWLQVHVPELDIVIGDDRSQGMLLVTNGHAGNRMLTIQPTTLRCRCANQLAMFDRLSRQGVGISRGIRIRHSNGLENAMADVQRSLMAARRAHLVTAPIYERLAAIPMTTAMVQAFFTESFATPPSDAASTDESDRARAIAAARETRLHEILASPTCNVPGTAGSAFALLNAVTEYIDHERATRGETVSARFASSTFGSGATLKESAAMRMLSMA